VAAPGRGLLVNVARPPVARHRGTGDVLTRHRRGLLAKGNGAAARRGAAAAAQQRASVEATQRSGLIAGDLIDALRARCADAPLRSCSSISVHCGAMCARFSTRLRARSCGPSSGDAYGHEAPPTPPARRSARCDGALRRDGPEGLALDATSRRRGSSSSARPETRGRHARIAARSSRVSGEIPGGVRVHLKLDTGMGRWGLSELPVPPATSVGLMSHLASANGCRLCGVADRAVSAPRPSPTAPERATSRTCAGAPAIPRRDSTPARCGGALYGLSPFGTDPAEDGLEPVLTWTSHVRQTRLLRSGEELRATAGRRRAEDTWIGSCRRLRGPASAEHDGHRRARRGRATARRRHGLDGRRSRLSSPRAAGARRPVVLLGTVVLSGARCASRATINYELASGHQQLSDPRPPVVVTDA